MNIAMSGVSGSEVRKFMRAHKVSIRELKSRMGVSLKYIRRVRKEGVEFLGALDFWNGISGQKELPPRMRAMLKSWMSARYPE